MNLDTPEVTNGEYILTMSRNEFSALVDAFRVVRLYNLPTGSTIFRMYRAWEQAYDRLENPHLKEEAKS